MAESRSAAAYLKALSMQAQSALPEQRLRLTQFPFRVGRDSRVSPMPTGVEQERRLGEQQANNDLYLWEPGPEFHASREHFEIVQEGSDYFLVDRKSALGTWVEGRLVGGNRKGGRVPLHNHDVIVVGSPHGGIIFKFVLDDAS